MLCLRKLLPQRNRGISLEGHWRVLTHKLYKFWGIYTITKLKIEISLSYHSSLMELVILLKQLWTPQLLLLTPRIFKEIDGSLWKTGIPQVLSISGHCPATYRSFLHVWGSYLNCWEDSCLPVLGISSLGEFPQLEIIFLKDMSPALAVCICCLLNKEYIALALLLWVRNSLKSHLWHSLWGPLMSYVCALSPTLCLIVLHSLLPMNIDPRSTKHYVRLSFLGKTACDTQILYIQAYLE